MVEALHLLRRQQKTLVGPAFNSLRGSNFDEPPPRRENFQPVSVFHSRGGGRLRPELLAQTERRRPRVRLTDGRGPGALGIASGQKQNEQRKKKETRAAQHRAECFYHCSRAISCLRLRLLSNSRTTKAGGSYFSGMRQPPASVRLAII